MLMMIETEILGALPDGALVVDSSGKVEAANSAARELLQFDPINLNATSVLRSPLFGQALADVLQTGTSASVELELRGKPSRQVSVQIAAMRASKKLLVLLRDFTREQAVEKMRSDFVANASHEMRTPLASIIGSIETLKGAAKDDPRAREQFLGTMLSQALRMKRLIDDLLTLSRIELNEHVRPSARVVLNDIARQAKSNLADMAATSNVTIEITDSATAVVLGDSDELLQVVQNLLENAIKYGGSGGRVELNCYAHQDQGCLAVRDFGKGIPDVHLPRLTERFYRVSTQESRSRGGTGLGLAIVKHIVLRHRGKLTIASKENVGSTFTVSIPLFKS